MYVFVFFVFRITIKFIRKPKTEKFQTLRRVTHCGSITRREKRGSGRNRPRTMTPPELRGARNVREIDVKSVKRRLTDRASLLSRHSRFIRLCYVLVVIWFVRVSRIHSRLGADVVIACRKPSAARKTASLPRRPTTGSSLWTVQTVGVTADDRCRTDEIRQCPFSRTRFVRPRCRRGRDGLWFRVPLLRESGRPVLRDIGRKTVSF